MIGRRRVELGQAAQRGFGTHASDEVARVDVGEG